jgi:hypothetical protein
MLAFIGYLRHETDRWEGIQAVANLLMRNLPKWVVETLQFDSTSLRPAVTLLHPAVYIDTR